MQYPAKRGHYPKERHRLLAPTWGVSAPWETEEVREGEEDQRRSSEKQCEIASQRSSGTVQ